ncbi:unnamed protein product [Candidula unifasciata]|uniref:Cystatin domain-containing protein n=1 Tax=Candidula unifasciata TaxID=100452 RepID=A0A8S3ZX41_9EUPU|nr:unnamed protein product [Candidula unifasciata]
MKILLLIATALPFITCQDIPGGKHALNVSLTDPNVVLALNAVNELYKTNGDQRLRTGVEVVSATSQIVAGVKYTYTIKVSGGDANELCTVSILRQPWISDKPALLGEPTCVPEKAGAAPPAALVGGQVDVSFSDPDVQKAVQFLESKINAKSNGLYYLKATGASKVTKQVVNGIIYRFYAVTYAESQCTQNDVKTGDQQTVCCGCQCSSARTVLR